MPTQPSALSDEEVAEIVRENERLHSEVHGLIRVQSQLLANQEALDSQRALYKKLAELGRQYETIVDLEDRSATLRRLVDFATVDLGHQRCVVLFPAEGGFCVEAHEGYYDLDLEQRIARIKLPRDALVSSGGSLEEVHCSELTADQRNTLASDLGIDDFLCIPFAASHRADDPRGVVVVGVEEHRKRYHQDTDPQNPFTNALRNVVQQTSAALRIIELYEALREERNSLERHVQGRTVELQQALERAREVDRVKMEFLSSVSHELRTPLNAIINIPEGLLPHLPEEEHVACPSCGEEFVLDPLEEVSDGEPCPACGSAGVWRRRTARAFVGDPDSTHHHLSSVVRSGKHLLAVVGDILDVSKLEAGKMEVHMSAIDGVALAREAVESMSTTASARGCSLVFTTDLSDARVHADSTKLRQVLLNLLSNALKFTDAGGRVELRVSLDGAWLAFTVEDDGLGIAQEHLSLVFESFRQIDGGSRRRHGGSGLGLAISQRLTQLMGGTIGVDSSPGEGSRFTVRLRVHSEHPAPSVNQEQIV